MSERVLPSLTGAATRFARTAPNPSNRIDEIVLNHHKAGAVAAAFGA